ncbi:MAG: acetate/propionate family kinase [Actinomycetota bacterium]|nr:acetate/propionate family kinase [Actinomycetota bacterium]
MRVLTVNAGSSSLKLRVLDRRDRVQHGADLSASAEGIDTAALTTVVRGWPTPDAVGHRIVHGGATFTGPARITGTVRDQLTELVDLAPLHQPKSLAALDAVTALLPDVAAVASFDTAFHTSISAAAATYAVPKKWREVFGIRRYGFHGLSHTYCSRQVAALLGQPLAELRIVSCHLGAGASLAAVVDGSSVDTTMGFTPLEGLVMATRSGTIDPGIVLWLQEHQQLSVHEISVALEEQSGLTALAGTGDMRDVEAAADRGAPEALLALDVYIHRLAGGIAAMAAAAGGMDVLAFTGGVGEHSPTVRRRTAQRLSFLGVVIDDGHNDSAQGDADISGIGSSVRTMVVTSQEDIQLAREARQVLGSAAST